MGEGEGGRTGKRAQREPVRSEGMREGRGRNKEQERGLATYPRQNRSSSSSRWSRLNNQPLEEQ